MYEKNKFLLEPGCINDAFELREPEFYKLVTTVTCDNDIRKKYTVTIGRWNQQTTFKESKYKKEPKSGLIVPGESISKKEPSKKSGKIPSHLYIVPVAPTLL